MTGRESSEGGRAPCVVRDLLVRAAALMIGGGYAVSIIESNLRSIASAYGLPQAKAIVLPTVAFVSVPGCEPAQLDVATVGGRALRLDQTAELGRILGIAQRAALPASEVLRLLGGVEGMAPRRSRWVRLVGYGVLTSGVGLLLRPTLFELGAIAILGAIVGGLVELWSRRPRVDYLEPVLAAAVVAAAACLFADANDGVNATRLIIPPLATFLPGAIIATALVDLTANQVISGSSLLVLGAIRLLLLALGIVAGAELVGADSKLFEQGSAHTLGGWAPWLGVAVFGCGVFLHYSAPHGSLRWVLLVLGVAWTAQLAGQRIFGGYLSGFVGSLAMTPTALLVERRPSAPSAQILFLPAFWMLVPSAVGLVGLTQLVGNHLDAARLQTSIVSFLAIGMGVYLGNALFVAAANAGIALKERPRLRMPRLLRRF